MYVQMSGVTCMCSLYYICTCVCECVCGRARCTCISRVFTCLLCVHVDVHVYAYILCKPVHYVCTCACICACGICTCVCAYGCMFAV